MACLFVLFLNPFFDLTELNAAESLSDIFSLLFLFSFWLNVIKKSNQNAILFSKQNSVVKNTKKPCFTGLF